MWIDADQSFNYSQLSTLLEYESQFCAGWYVKDLSNTVMIADWNEEDFKKQGYIINWKDIESQNPTQTLNTLSMASPFTLEEKQILLETANLKERKQKLEEILTNNGKPAIALRGCNNSQRAGHETDVKYSDLNWDNSVVQCYAHTIKIIKQDLVSSFTEGMKGFFIEESKKIIKKNFCCDFSCCV